MLGFITFSFVQFLCSLLSYYNPLFAYVDALFMGSRLVSPVQSTDGYDAPVSDQDQDDLNRWALSRSVLRAIESTPDEWSIRIALYGKWGSGKTSVLNFVEKQIKQQSNRISKDSASTQVIIVRFSAWDAAGVDGVLEQFYRALLDKLPSDKPSCFSIFRQVKRLANWCARFVNMLWTGLVSLLNPSVEPISAGTIAALRKTLDHAQKLTVFDKKDLARLQYELTGYRVVVFIDDLDRADPKIIPHTMLALRELLDWPRFAFILAFDLSVISEALGTYSPVFGKDARRFLEKIIDVQLEVPEPTEKELVVLGRRLFESYCSFIPNEAREQALAWLPRNPRLVKVIVRDLSLLENAATRHAPDELNWAAIILQTILKHEAPKTLSAVYPALLGRDPAPEETTAAGGLIALTKAAVAKSFDDTDPDTGAVYKRLEVKVVALQGLR